MLRALRDTRNALSLAREAECVPCNTDGSVFVDHCELVIVEESVAVSQTIRCAHEAIGGMTHYHACAQERILAFGASQVCMDLFTYIGIPRHALGRKAFQAAK